MSTKTENIDGATGPGVKLILADCSRESILDH
jgi:hypothetical protein